MPVDLGFGGKCEVMSPLAATLHNAGIARLHADDLASAALYIWASTQFESASVSSEAKEAFRVQILDRIEGAQRRRDFELALQLDGLHAIFGPEDRLAVDPDVAAQRSFARRLDAERAMLRGELESAAGFSLASLALNPGDDSARRHLKEAADGLSARYQSLAQEAPSLEGTLALCLAVALGVSDHRKELADLLYALSDFASAALLCQRIEADEGAGFSARFDAARLRLQARHRSLGADQASAETLAAPEIRAWLAALGPSSGLEETALRTRLDLCFGDGGRRQTLADLRALRRFAPEDPWVAHHFCIVLLNALFPDVADSVDVILRHTSDDPADLQSRYDMMVRIGAIPQALALAERLIPHYPEYAVIGALHGMATDLDAKPAHVFGRARMGRPLLYANLVCWGDSYVDLMERAAIASLLAPGNIPALAAKADVVVELFTTAADAQRLRESKALERLARHCEIQIHCFPDVVAARNKAFGYATYGYALHATALRAERDGADVTFLMPDLIYADGGYGLIAEKLTSAPRAIFVDGLNAYAAPMLDRMQPFYQDEALVVPPQQLIEAMTRCLSKRTLHSLYRPGDGRTCVQPSRVIFPLEGGLRTHGFVMLPVYVSHAALSPFVMKNFGTQDGIMSEHILNAVDDEGLEVLSGLEFCYAEICDDDGKLLPMIDVDLVTAARDYFTIYGLGRNRLRLFDQPIDFPTLSPPDLPLVSAEEAAARVRDVKTMFATDPIMIDVAEEQERLRAALYRR